MIVARSVEELSYLITQIYEESNESLIDSWETSMNFMSQRRAVNAVIDAQDSIDTYAQSLSIAEQTSLAAQSEIHSTIFEQKLTSGLIKYYGDSATGVYWDFSCPNAAYTPVLNEAGLVKAGGKIYQFTANNLVKIIKDGDFNKISGLAMMNTPVENETYSIFPFNQYNPFIPSAPEGGGPTGCLNNEYGKSNTWVQTPTNSKRRVRVNLVGASKGVSSNTQGPDCPPGMAFSLISCSFFLKLEAQKVNFWGNWVRSKNFKPRLDISGATWSFSYSFYRNGCTGNYVEESNDLIVTTPIEFNGVLQPLPSLPVLNLTDNGTNFKIIFLNPHVESFWQTGKFVGGVFVPDFWRCAVNMDSYKFPLTYGGVGNNVWGFVK